MSTRKRLRVIVREGNTSEGQLEFYLTGLDDYDDFDLVTSLLNQKQHIELVNKVDGIFSRIGVMRLPDSRLFKVIYHDDVGIYVFSVEQSPNINDLLRRVMEQVANDINEVG